MAPIVPPEERSVTRGTLLHKADVGARSVAPDESTAQEGSLSHRGLPAQPSDGLPTPSALEVARSINLHIGLTNCLYASLKPDLQAAAAEDVKPDIAGHLASLPILHGLAQDAREIVLCDLFGRAHEQALLLHSPVHEFVYVVLVVA